MKLVRARLAGRLLVGVVGVVVTPLLAAPAHADLWAVPRAVSTSSAAAQFDLGSFEDEVMIGINRARRAAGLRKIKFYDSCVDRLAEEWAAHVATTGTWVHRDQLQVLRKCDQTWVGECLVQGASLTPEVVVQAWLGSPSHRAVLMKRRASRAGIAITLDARGHYIGVLNVSDPT